MPSLYSTPSRSTWHYHLPFVLLLAALYLLPGVIGRDPWRGDDLRAFGVVAGMLGGDSWLLPHLAGVALPEQAPLYYWSAALSAWLLSPVLALHDGARLATTLWIIVTLWSCHHAARRLFDDEAIATCVLVLILGTLALLVQTHQLQPRTALMATVALTLAGAARLPTAPRSGALLGCAGVALSALAGGPLALLLTLPLLWFPVVGSGPGHAGLRAGASLVAVLLAALWPLALASTAPAQYELWREAAMQPYLADGKQLGALLPQLAGGLWPLWPLALWALYRRRGQWRAHGLQLPLVALPLGLLWLVFADHADQAGILVLLPGCALLAAAGAGTLRRGAANAFDWFALMCCAVFAILVWLAWSAQIWQWPPGLARSLARLSPEFTPQTVALPAVLAAIVCVAWLALALRLPPSPWRGSMRWLLGVVMLWSLAVILLTPWVDQDRNYRPLTVALAAEMAHHPVGCIAERGLNNNHRAAFDAFAGLRTEWLDPQAAVITTHCPYLLIRDTTLIGSSPAAPWQLAWQDTHGGGRRLERFRLFVQQQDESP